MPSPPSAESEGLIVLRVAEIFLKGKNRHTFFRAFVRNARRLLADVEGARVETLHLRAAVRHPPALRRACIERLERLFGLSSMSPAVPCAPDLDAIAETCVAAARELPPGTSFKVETNRRDKSFPMTSPEISSEVGGRVADATGLPVDVRRPARVLEIEIAPEVCFVYDESVPGPGGLPVGTGGDTMLLLSGGIDSPVAGWSMMRRGCRLSAVYFHSFPYTGDRTKEKVLDLAAHLARWQGRLPVWVVHFTEVQKQLRSHGPGELAVLLYRRMMMRAAALLAERDECRALVTGENLGQVASQTLDNLAVIEDASPLPVLRPLIAHDKLEIVALARRVGTYETSILPYDDCCSLFVPRHPATRARASELRAAEVGLDVEAMATELAEGAERRVVG
jgi:tRNA uracil 4-sulfurtransferase